MRDTGYPGCGAGKFKLPAKAELPPPGKLEPCGMCQSPGCPQCFPPPKHAVLTDDWWAREVLASVEETPINKVAYDKIREWAAKQPGGFITVGSDAKPTTIRKRPYDEDPLRPSA